MNTHRSRPYRDRIEAGDELARAVSAYLEAAETPLPPAVVLGLPRGGVPVAERVADHLNAPLDVVIVRKLGVPRQREVAMGALATAGDRVVRVEHSNIVEALRVQGISQDEIDQVEAVELAELRRRQGAYRGDAPDLELSGKTAIVVDDGLATGATMLAAVGAVRDAGAETIIVAVPVALQGARDAFDEAADAVICPWQADLYAIGAAYDPFTQVQDSEVRASIERAKAL